MICVECSRSVVDAEDLIDGLCETCVDKLLVLRVPANDGGEERKPPMRSVGNWKSAKRDWQL